MEKSSNGEYIHESLHGIDHKIPEENIMKYVTADFDKHAADKVAMVDGISGCSYTYAQLKTLFTKCASGLARRGFKQGDVLCIYSPNVPEYIIMVGAVLTMGGTVTTVNPLYTVDELRQQLENCEATIIVTIPQFANKAKEARKSLPDIKEIYVFGESEDCASFTDLATDDGSAFPDSVVIQMDDVAYLLYSSGTTGLPKGVMLTHKNIVSNMFQALSTPGAMPYDPDTDVALALLPFYHIYGGVPIGLDSLKIGIKIVTLPRFEPEVFLKTLQDYKITIGYLVPPLLLFLTKHPIVEKYDLSALKDVICGAAPLGGELAKAFQKRLNVPYIRQGYGLTETSPILSIGIRGQGRPDSAGILVCNTTAKIVDVTSGKTLPTGEEGELWVRGPQVMKGYLKNPEATAHCIDEEGYFHTGDIGYFTEDGHLFIVDRLKELIKYKGSQVAPAELEALLLTHPGVADAAVIGVPDEEAGELPKAFVVLKAKLSEEDICKFVAEKAAPHKKLRGGVEFVQAIPKSASGKILRRQLRGEPEREVENI